MQGRDDLPRFPVDVAEGPLDIEEDYTGGGSLIEDLHQLIHVPEIP
jgi:hypothetical protein